MLTLRTRSKTSIQELLSMLSLVDSSDSRSSKGKNM